MGVLRSIAMADHIEDDANMTVAKALVTNDLYADYWVAVEQKGTTDLVLVRDVSFPAARIAMTRQECLTDPRTPEGMRELVAVPAIESAAQGTKPIASFWLAVFFPDDLKVLAVNGNRMVRGGSA